MERLYRKLAYTGLFLLPLLCGGILSGAEPVEAAKASEALSKASLALFTANNVI
jgi:hypothetical protein